MIEAPRHVYNYLKNYSDADRQIIAHALDNTLNDILSNVLVNKIEPRADFVMMAGADGVGKTTLMNAYVANAARQQKPYISLDAGPLLDRLAGKVSLMGTFAEFAHHENAEVADSVIAARENQMERTKHWRLASLYLRDRLVFECMKRGLPIALETSAHGEHIFDFIADVKNFQYEGEAKNYRVSMLLCDAPLGIKLRASQKRAHDLKGYVSDNDVKTKDADMTLRMPGFPRHVDELAIYWRSHESQALNLIVASDGYKFIFPKDTKEQRERLAEFDANRPGISAYGLVGAHRQHITLQKRGKTVADYAPGARLQA